MDSECVVSFSWETSHAKSDHFCISFTGDVSVAVLLLFSVKLSFASTRPSQFSERCGELGVSQEEESVQSRLTDDHTDPGGFAR